MVENKEGEKLQLECEILELDRDLKAQELMIKRSFWKNFWRNLNATVVLTVLGTVLAALIAFMGNILIEYIKHDSSLSIQKKKDEAALVLEASKSLDPEKVTMMLKFFIETRLIENAEIEKFLKEKGNIFGTLTTWDDKGALYPEILKNWTIDPEAKRYTLGLRLNIILKDGRMLTAEILKEYIEKSKIPNIKEMEIGKRKFGSSEARDTSVLIVILHKPDLQFMQRLSVVEIPLKKEIK
jgi:hypothetical protein